MAEAGNITVLLKEADAGREGALDELMDLVYEDLERIALAQLSRQFGGRVNSITIEPAALVNETFLRLIKQRQAYDNRGQFFAIATKVMLRVLCDYQRRRGTAKRGGDRKRIALFVDGRPGPCAPAEGHVQIEVESLIIALERLEAIDPRQAEVVKMRVVWGLEIEEIAEALETSPSTVKRDWRFARSWLIEEASRMDQATNS